MKILVADDDAVSRHILTAILDDLGHEVVAVADGSEAIAALSGSDAPSVALLDWMMPGADGPAVCQEIRRRPGLYVYVILVTARDSPDDVVAGIEAGADDFLTKPVRPWQLSARLTTAARVLALQRGLLEAQEALRVEATRDRLTGLWNRGRILDQLEIELSRSRREQRPLSVALADIDHFKSINDRFGHAAGDDVLRRAAERMREALRGCDYVGRFGGEEFLFVFPNCSTSGGVQAAERVRGAIGTAPMRVAGGLLTVTLSVGVASSETPLDDAPELIAAADEALYRAKARGRNRVEAALPAKPMTLLRATGGR